VSARPSVERPFGATIKTTVHRLPRVSRRALKIVSSIATRERAKHPPFLIRKSGYVFGWRALQCHDFVRTKQLTSSSSDSHCRRYQCIDTLGENSCDNSIFNQSSVSCFDDGCDLSDFFSSAVYLSPYSAGNSAGFFACSCCDVRHSCVGPNAHRLLY